jgi:D-xylulose reductase
MFTFKLPENVSYGEGAMVEPLAVGMQAAKKAAIHAGDVAVVTGCGTIGMVTAMAALAGGCSKVIISDMIQPKLDIASHFGFAAVNITKQNLKSEVDNLTNGWGADVVFEASGNETAVLKVFELVRPGGCVVFIGMPVKPVPVDIVSAQAKEARIETVFRYAHVYERALGLMGSGKIDVKPLITDKYKFDDSIKALEYASKPKPTSVKVIIEM